MVGKGQRRREKNYRAAHGGGGGAGNNRLPPPPDHSSLDALPSKLRQIMPFTSGSSKISADAKQKYRRGGGVDKKLHSEGEFDSKSPEIKREVTNGNLMPQQKDHGDKIVQNTTNEKKKKKRKRKQVDDLRFEMVGVAGSKTRERKKQWLKDRRKKNKVKAEENLDFPGHEMINFGEVVKAPPKLVALPKASKATQDASRERLRLQAVEDYRKRKGWESRPGIQLPQSVIT